MKTAIFTFLLVVVNSCLVYSQIKATTQNGEAVVLMENGTWEYDNTVDHSHETLSEQFEEAYEYAKYKLVLNTSKYISYGKYEDEAITYARKHLEKNGKFKATGKNLSMQFDEVYKYAKYKLGLNTCKYISYGNYEDEAKTYTKEYLEMNGRVDAFGKNISEQFDEVYSYAKNKLGLDTHKYISYGKYEDEAKIYSEEYLKLRNEK